MKNMLACANTSNRYNAVFGTDVIVSLFEVTGWPSGHPWYRE